MNSTFLPKRPDQMTQVVNLQRGLNQQSQLNKINTQLSQIANRDNDVKSSIQNLKRKLNISSNLEEFDVSYSSISVVENCNNCASMRKKMQQLKMKSNPIRQQMKVMALQNAKLSKQLKKSQQKVEDLEQEIAYRQSCNRSQEQKQAKMLTQFKIKVLQNTSLSKQNNQLIKDIEKLNREIDKLNREVTQLKRQLQKSHEAKDSFVKRQNAELEKTVKMYASMIREKDEEFQRQLRMREQQLERQQLEYQAVNRKHIELYEQLNTELKQKQKVIQLINTKTSSASISQSTRTKQLQLHNVELSSHISQLQQQLTLITNQNTYMKQMIANYQIQLLQQAQRIQELQKNNDSKNTLISKEKNIQLLKQFEELKNQVTQAYKMEDNYLQKIQELESYYNSQLQINEALTSNVKRIESEKQLIVEENRLMKQENQLAKQQLSRINGLFKDLQHQKQVLTKTNILLTNQIKDLQQTLKQKTQQLQSKSQRLYMFQNSIARVENDYKANIQWLEKQLEATKKNLSALTQSNRRMEGEYVDKVQSLLNELSVCHSQLQQEKIQKDSETQSHTRINAELLSVKQSFSKKESEFNELIKQFQVSLNRIQSLEQEKNSQCEELDVLKNTIIEVNKQLAFTKSQAMKAQQQLKVHEHQRQVYEREIELLKASLKEKSGNEYKQYDKFERVNQELLEVKRQSMEMQSNYQQLQSLLAEKEQEISSRNTKISQLNIYNEELLRRISEQQQELSLTKTTLSEFQLQANLKHYELTITVQNLQEDLHKHQLLIQEINFTHEKHKENCFKEETLLKQHIDQLLAEIQKLEEKLVEEQLRRAHEVEDKDREIMEIKQELTEVVKLAQDNTIVTEKEEILKLSRQLEQLKMQNQALLATQHKTETNKTSSLPSPHHTQTLPITPQNFSQIEQSLKQQLTELTNDNTQVRQHIAFLQTQLSIQNTDNVNLFQDNKKLFTQNQQLTQKLNALQFNHPSTFTQQSIQIFQTKSQVPSVPQFNTTISQSQQIQSQQLLAQNASLKVQITKLNEALLYHQVQIQSLNSMVSGLIQEKNLLTQDISNLFIQRNTLVQLNTALTDERNALVQENNSLAIQINNLSIQNANLLNDRNNAVDQRNALINERSNLIEERDNFINDKIKLENNLEQVMNQLENTLEEKHHPEPSDFINSIPNIQPVPSNTQKSASQVGQENKLFINSPLVQSRQILEETRISQASGKKLQQKLLELKERQEQLQQKSQFLNSKEILLTEKQSSFTTKKKLLQQLQAKLKEKLSEIQEKTAWLEKQETKFRENETNVEETLINAKKMLEIIEKKSIKLQKIRQKKKKLLDQNITNQSKIQPQSTTNKGQPQIPDQSSVSPIKPQIPPETLLNPAFMVGSQEEQQEQQSPSYPQQEHLQQDLNNLQSKISAFLKSHKQERQLRASEFMKIQLQSLGDNFKDNEQLIELLQNIKQNKKSNQQTMFNPSEMSIYLAQIQTYLITRFQELKQSSSHQFKEITLLISQILQNYRLLISSKSQEAIRKLIADSKDSIDKLLGMIKTAFKLPPCPSPKAQSFKKIEKSGSESQLVRNESTEFKKKKSPAPTRQLKHTYSQLYSQRKPSEKTEFVEQTAKSETQGKEQQQEQFYQEEEPIQDIPKRKQKSILLIDDIGEAVSIDQEQDHQQEKTSLANYSLKASSGNGSASKAQLQTSSRKLEKSFDLQGSEIHSPDANNMSKEFEQGMPALMLSQQSSMSRKEMEDRYKSNIKSSKLASKLKNKRKK